MIAVTRSGRLRLSISTLLLTISMVSADAFIGECGIPLRLCCTAQQKNYRANALYFIELSLLRLKLLFFDGDCIRYPSLLLPPFDRGFT